MRSGDLHLVVYIRCTGIQRTAEYAGERKDVVDLVRIIAAARTDNCGAGALCFIGEYLRRGVCAGKHYRVVCHSPHHVGGQDSGGGYSDEHVRVLDNVGKCSLFAGAVRCFRDLLLCGIKAGAAVKYGAGSVGHDYISRTDGNEQLYDSYSGSSCAGGYDLHVLKTLADDLQRVHKSGQHYDRRSVLVIVENGDIAALLELALYLKAARSGDILKVHAAKRACKQRDGVYDLVNILAANAQWNGIDAAEFLKQQALSLHDRHSGLGAYITEAENGRSVGDNGDGIPASRKLIAFVYILLYLKAGRGNAGCVGKAERLAIICLRTRGDLDLALEFIVQFKRFLCVIHYFSTSFKYCALPSLYKSLP